MIMFMTKLTRREVKINGMWNISGGERWGNVI